MVAESRDTLIVTMSVFRTNVGKFMSRLASVVAAEAVLCSILYKNRIVKVTSPMILFETRGLQLYWVMRGGIGSE